LLPKGKSGDESGDGEPMSEPSADALRRKLHHTLARGRLNAVPELLPQHLPSLEYRAGRIVVER
jgi:hypothetical protein